MSVDEEIANYLSEIDGSTVVMNRVLALRPRLDDLLPDGQHIERAFINEYLDPNDSRTYESAWFFSAAFAMEAHDFLSTDVFDCIKFESNVGYFRISMTDFTSPAGATSRSRMSVNFSFFTPSGEPFALGAFSGTFKASGRNCRHLYSVVKQIIVPNLVTKS